MRKLRFQSDIFRGNPFNKCQKVAFASLIFTVICGLQVVLMSQKDVESFTVGSAADQFLIPSDDTLEQMSDIQLVDVFNKYINSLQVMCRNIQRLGSLLDGGKEVCVDKVIRPKSPCLVYSFGKWNEDMRFYAIGDDENARKLIQQELSNNKFDFEDKVIKNFGCQVLTFDPTMNNIKTVDLKIPPGCQFYRQGLEGSNQPHRQMFTLGTLLKQYHHTKRVLDILKVDIEGSEYAALEEMMTSGTLENVRQLLVEFHFHEISKTERVRRLAVFRRLYEYGFRIYSRERNVGKSQYLPELGYSVVYFVEISFINTRFL